ENSQSLEGPPDYQTLFQQSPDDERSRLHIDYFPLFKTQPAGAATVLSIDTARGLADRNSYSVSQVWCATGGQHLLLNVWRGRVDAEALLKQIIGQIRYYGPTF